MQQSENRKLLGYANVYRTEDGLALELGSADIDDLAEVHPYVADWQEHVGIAEIRLLPSTNGKSGSEVLAALTQSDPTPLPAAVDGERLMKAAEAGWNACRRQVYLLSEDYVERTHALKGADSVEGNFYRGQYDVAKSFAKAFSAFGARDCDYFKQIDFSDAPLPSGTVGEPVGVKPFGYVYEATAWRDGGVGRREFTFCAEKRSISPDDIEEFEIVETAVYASPPSEPAPQVVGDWRPIETAPKDGGDILCYGEYHGTPVLFVARWNLVQWYAGWGNAIQPAHWQPLPALPTDGKEEANV